MINLIFDVNNIAHRSLFVTGGYGSKAYTYDTQNEIDQFVRKMGIDISYIIRMIRPSRIIFAQDSGSWRKTIKIEENDGYKGNRFKSAKINWNNVYNALEEFTEILQSSGILITKIDKAEADDIICLWSNELQFNQKQHVIIVSGDEDMRQLVSTHYNDSSKDNVSFCTVFNPFMQGKNASRKLYVPKYFEEWINKADEVDFMNLKGTINIDKEDFRNIISGERTKMEYINGRMIGLRKMFCGDDGDNIPSVYSWINDKGNEKRITNSLFEKIYEYIINEPDEIIDYYDVQERSDRVLYALKKVTKQDNIEIDINERLKRQIKLVILSPCLFPKEITETFNILKVSELNKPKINLGNVNMYNLLEGTKYVKTSKDTNEIDIFKEIDRMSGKSLF